MAIDTDADRSAGETRRAKAPVAEKKSDLEKRRFTADEVNGFDASTRDYLYAHPEVTPQGWRKPEAEPVAPASPQNPPIVVMVRDGWTSLRNRFRRQPRQNERPQIITREENGSRNAFWFVVVLVIVLAFLAWFVWPGQNTIRSLFGQPTASAPAQSSPSPTSSQTVASAQTTGPIKTLLIDMPRYGVVVNTDDLPMVVVDKGSGKATYNAKAQVVDANGRSVQGAKVSVQGKTYTTDSSGWAYFPLEFSSTNPVSEKNTVRIEVDGKTQVYEIWAARILDNPVVSQPTLDRGTVASVNATDARFRNALLAAGVTPENLVGIDVGASDGKTSMIQMDQNGNVSTGGTVPAGQPVWVLSYRMSDGTIKKVFINPVCMNVFTPVPQPSPTPAPTRCVVAITAAKFIDLNGNGVRDNSDFAQAGVTFRLSRVSDNREIASGATNSTGIIVFDGGLPPGTYTVREDVPTNATATTASVQTVTVNCGDIKILNFGNRVVSGIVPTPVPTTQPTPVPTPQPTPVPTLTPTPTPAPTKNPSNMPSTPPPPPPSVAPPPTQSPRPPSGTVTVTGSTSCGTGCWQVTWTSSDTFGGFLLYGLQGYSRSSRVDGFSVGPNTYTASMVRLESGRTYEFQAYAYPNDGSTPVRSSVISFNSP